MRSITKRQNRRIRWQQMVRKLTMLDQLHDEGLTPDEAEAAYAAKPKRKCPKIVLKQPHVLNRAVQHNRTSVHQWLKSLEDDTISQ